MKAPGHGLIATFKATQVRSLRSRCWAIPGDERLPISAERPSTDTNTNAAMVSAPGHGVDRRRRRIEGYRQGLGANLLGRLVSMATSEGTRCPGHPVREPKSDFVGASES